MRPLSRGSAGVTGSLSGWPRIARPLLSSSRLSAPPFLGALSGPHVTVCARRPLKPVSRQRASHLAQSPGRDPSRCGGPCASSAGVGVSPRCSRSPGPPPSLLPSLSQAFSFLHASVRPASVQLFTLTPPVPFLLLCGLLGGTFRVYSSTGPLGGRAGLGP